MIEVFKPGTEVEVPDAGYLRVRIISAIIRRDNIVYDVGWWDGREYKTGEFYESELHQVVGEKLKLGFKGDA
jgi:hypothetical protein